MQRYAAEFQTAGRRFVDLLDLAFEVFDFRRLLRDAFIDIRGRRGLRDAQVRDLGAQLLNLL